MKKPKPGSKNYDERYLKWWRKQDRRGRDLSPWQMFKSLFQKEKK